jgi:hypothetical protein
MKLLSRLLIALCCAVLSGQPVLAASLPLTGAGSASGSGYSAPTLTGQLELLGDSIHGLGGGVGYSSANFTLTYGGGSYLGELAGRCSGCFYVGPNFNYGVSGQTAYAVTALLNSQRNDAGRAASTGSTLSGTTLTVGSATVSQYGLNEDLTGTSVTGQGVKITAFGSAGNTVTSGVGGTNGTYTVLNPNSVSIGVGQAINATPNPAFAYTAFGVSTAGENQFATNNTNNFTSLNDPANLVVLSVGSNDSLWAGASGAGSCKTETCDLQQIGLILDALGPNGASFTNPTAISVSGANKRVVLLGMKPNGIAWFGGETQTMGATVTNTNHASLVAGDDTCTDASSVAWNDAPVVFPGVAAGAGTNVVATRVGSAPAVGQYTFTPATGVYGFNATDATTYSGRKILLNYCEHGVGNLTGANLTWWVDLQAWLKSSASSYTAPAVGAGGSGTAYGIPGALSGRPWVSYTDDTAATMDLATAHSTVVAGGTCVVSCTYLPIPSAMRSDGIHYGPAGTPRASSAVATTVAGLLPSTHVDFTIPTYNNFVVIKSVAIGTLTYNGVLPGVQATQIASATSSGHFALCYGIACAVADGTGALLSNGVTQGTTTFGAQGTNVGCINYTTAQTCNSVNTVGQWKINTMSVGIPANGLLTAYLEPPTDILGNRLTAPGGNILQNGQMDWATTTASSNGSATNISTCATSGAGTSGSNYPPAGWNLAADANTQTAITAGTVIINCGYGTAPDGNPGFWVSYYGATGASATLTLKQNLNTTGYPASAFITVNTDTTRAYMRITRVLGPADSDAVQRVYGFGSPTLTQANQMTVSGPKFGIPCPTTACSVVSGVVSDNPVFYTSKSFIDFSNTALMYDWVTPPADAFVDTTGGQTLTLTSVTVSHNLVSNGPISGKIWYQNAGERVVAH